MMSNDQRIASAGHVPRNWSISFLSLPNELKYHILNYIVADTNTLHALRQVHPWFKSQISIFDLRKQVLTARIPPGCLVCHTCFRILPIDDFEPFQQPRFGTAWGEMTRFECFYDLKRRKQTCFTCRTWRSAPTRVLYRS
ncbi:MAG: hypothetical protein Q9168_000893 [Polycauliona sp. 1 TL-2023]